MSDRFPRIHDAFVRGDLDALRASVEDPSVVPNGIAHPACGSCLTYAIYHSPIAFVRALLALGADPNDATDASFPPLVAALGCSREMDGAPRRTDVDDLIRLLLRFGADPNQRGVNDYTALHMAVAERNALAIERLLEGGADPDLRTRIDECETPLEMAQAAGLTDIAARLERRGQPLRTRLRSGVTLLFDVPGHGDLVRRQHRYAVRLRWWLADGTPVRWSIPAGPVGSARLEDDGETLLTEIRIDRGSLVNGLFYGVDGMQVGGTRRLELAPHVAYAERGVPGLIPPGATLVVEVTILEAAGDHHTGPSESSRSSG